MGRYLLVLGYGSTRMRRSRTRAAHTRAAEGGGGALGTALTHNIDPEHARISHARYEAASSARHSFYMLVNLLISDSPSCKSSILTHVVLCQRMACTKQYKFQQVGITVPSFYKGITRMEGPCSAFSMSPCCRLWHRTALPAQGKPVCLAARLLSRVF